MDPYHNPLTALEKEEKRLESLRSYRILDTGIEKELEELNHLAASICETPVSLIVLLDKERQWFKSKYGWDKSETERSFSFCHYTLLEEKAVMEVENALQDSRFEKNPLVLGEPNIRYYCGAPLVNAEGYRLGSLCVIDKEPRKLAPSQLEALIVLSHQVVTHFELHKHNIQLADQKKLLEEDAEKRTKELLEINNELKTFIYKASHDIRGPIATIIGLSNLAHMKAQDDEVKYCVKKIIETGDRLDETLKNLLKIMRLKEDEIQLSVLDSKKISEDISKIARNYTSNGAKFQVEVEPDISFVTDKELLSIVIKNIIDNSFKFSNEKNEDSLVIVKVSREDAGLVKITVEDNGEGIDDQIKSSIYDLFFRGSVKSKGSGLGLFIAKKAVEKLKGEIVFSSVPNSKTIFTIYLKSDCF